MKLLRFIVIISMFGVAFSSCEEQVLTKATQDSFTEDDIWGDISLARSYLNKVYQGVGGWGITSENGPREMPNSATDEAMQRGDHGIWVLNQGNITASDYGTFNKWADNYEAIRRCNIFLQNIDSVPNVESDEVELMKAQARFIRAKLYADLVNWYSWWEGDGNGVPLIREPFSLQDEFDIARADYTEVVDFIVAELDDVASILPEEWDTESWGRITKGAAFALKSEILLYAASQRHNPSMDQSKWQQASDAAKAVIDMNLYRLSEVNSWEDYARIFLNSTDNPEIILARPYDPEYVDDNWVDKMNSPNGYMGWGGNCPTQNYVDKFQMDSGVDINESGSSYDPQSPYVDREMRFYANIVYNGRMYRGREVEFFNGGRDSKDGPQGWNACPTGYTLYKFMDESIDFSTTNAATPYIIYRLAEIYLNYAEAQFHLGNEAEAREYVNRVRTRAMLPEIQSSGAQLLQDIRHERSIELAFENDHRWNDLRRWEILDQVADENYIKIDIEKGDAGNLTYNRVLALERNFQPRMYSLPIPLEEIQKSGLKQNPGY